MTLRAIGGEGVREGRRGRANVLDAGFIVQVAAPAGPWTTSDVCGLEVDRALDFALARVGETLEATDLCGDPVAVRRFDRVRLVRGRTVLCSWRRGELHDDGEAASLGAR